MITLGFFPKISLMGLYCSHFLFKKERKEKKNTTIFAILCMSFLYLAQLVDFHQVK